MYTNVVCQPCALLFSDVQINFDEIGKKPWITRQPSNVRKAFAGAFACMLVGEGFDTFHTKWSHSFLEALITQRLQLSQDDVVAFSSLAHLPDKSKAEE